MAYIQWSDEFSVGVREIDDQHKKLFETLNTFYDSMGSDNQAALGKLLNSLADYTMYHFRTEEKYFDKFQYAESQKHKQEHQEFVDQVLDVKGKFESGKLVLSVAITGFIKKWIQEHVKDSDQKYRQCFIENGLS